MEKTPLILNDRELSKKEIRMLKELTTTRGELKSWEWLKKPKYRMFILEVFTSFSAYRQLSSIAKVEVGCHIKSFISEDLYKIESFLETIPINNILFLFAY